MSSIPKDIYRNIFLRLPVKSTVACKYVCKSWFSIISDPGFIRMHLKASPQRAISNNLLVGGYDDGQKDAIYSISFDLLERSLSEKELSLMKISYPYISYGVELSRMSFPYEFLGYGIELLDSCNGLVSLVFFDNDNQELFFCLWNPATHEYKKITKPTNNFAYVNIRMCAFGYDNNNDDYKLVIGVDDGHNSIFYVYALGSNSWKSAITIHYSFCSDWKSGLLVNGRFHWLVEGRQGRLIMSLDISDERFEECELPLELQENEIELQENENSFITEGVLEGCLCLLVADPGDGYPCLVGVWVWQDYGVRESWTKCYAITNWTVTRATMQCYCHPLRFVCSFKSGKILLMSLDKLIIYDPKDETAIERDMGSVRGFRSEVKYFESLVSVYSGIYTRTEE